MLNVIPRPVQELYLSDKRSEVSKSVVLYADISGFTSITESLLDYGKSGAGVLSSVLNGIFSRAINEIYRNGGSVAGFEGDAIIAVFPAENPQGAFKAAIKLNSYFGRNPEWMTDIGKWPVSVRLSIARGQVEWGITGNDRLAYYIKGPALTRAARFSSEKEVGSKSGIHSSCSELALELCGRSLEEISKTPSNGKFHPPKRILKGIAAKFVSESIISSRLSGEFRSVTPVFIQVKYHNDQSLRSRAMKILSSASIYGGELNGLYCSDPEFATALILFGAPVSWENNSSRAFDFSLKLIEELGDTIRVGISEGKVYAGIVGNSRRCTYTVYGDTVNTTARLVLQAEFGEILVTEKSILDLGYKYSFTDTRRWLPRGKSDWTLIGRLNSLKNAGTRRSFTGKMLGRSTQMRTLLHSIEPVTKGSFAGAAAVFGEAGMGKSRLLFEASRQYSDSCQAFVLKCDDILRRSLNPFEYFLKDLFRQSETSDRIQNSSIFDDRFRELADDLRNAVSDESEFPVELERTYSIIASILGYFSKDSVYSKLAVESRFENTVLALKTLVKALSLIKPVILIIEDLQWMDSESREVLSTLTRDVEEYPFILLFSSRYFDDGEKPSLPIDNSTDSVSINLKGIDKESATGIILDRLGDKPTPDLADYILRSSSGNPFYIEQFCMYLKESGLISDQSGSYQLVSRKYDIPSGIKSILVARMDRLPNNVRKFLQTASILGQEFSVDTLNLISGREGKRELLVEGERLQLWSHQSGSTFTFNHALYRDTAYGMLLGKSLHRLHSKAAEVLIEINRQNPESAAGEISLHLKESQQISKAINWGWRALCDSMENYRNNDALEWADRLKDWMMLNSIKGSRDELLLDVLLRKDSVLNSLADRPGQKENTDLMTEICREEGWTHRTAEVLKAKGAHAFSTGDIESAFILFSEGLELSKRSTDTGIRGKLFGNIANLYSIQGKDSLAREYYDMALQIHRNLGNRRQKGVTLGNLAILLRRCGREEEARSCYEEALNLHRETGNRIGEGRILCGLGNLEEKPEDALVYYREALKINREIGDRRNEAIILSNLGRIQTKQENYVKASEYLEEALSIHMEISNSTGRADTHCLLGEMFYFMKQWNEAREHFNQAIALSRKTGNSRQECIYHGIMGLVNFEDGIVREAIASYRKAYNLVIEFQFPVSIDDSLEMLREKLLEEGISEQEVPIPAHWGRA